jgi:hypothetical protein
MITHESAITSHNQRTFAQDKPHHICQNRGEFKKRSTLLGYKCRCRDPRCSLECLKAWADQESWILELFWDDILTRSYRRYRGNLTMPKDAALNLHRTARAAFGQAISRYRSAHRCIIMYRCYSDITSHNDCHYDLIMYSDLEPGRLRRVVSDSWRLAGGLRSTVRPLHTTDDSSEEKAWSKYIVKSRKVDRKRWRFVPVRGGLPFTWGTDGFWGKGNTRQSLWKEWIRRTFPERRTVSILPLVQLTISKRSADNLMNEWHSKVGRVKVVHYPHDAPIAAWAEDLASRYPDTVKITSNKPKYVPPDRLLDLVIILPTAPEDAVALPDLAKAIGEDVITTKGLMSQVSGIVRLKEVDFGDAPIQILYDRYYWSRPNPDSPLTPGASQDGPGCPRFNRQQVYR